MEGKEEKSSEEENKEKAGEEDRALEEHTEELSKISQQIMCVKYLVPHGSCNRLLVQTSHSVTSVRALNRA